MNLACLRCSWMSAGSCDGRDACSYASGNRISVGCVGILFAKSSRSNSDPSNSTRIVVLDPTIVSDVGAWKIHEDEKSTKYNCEQVKNYCGREIDSVPALSGCQDRSFSANAVCMSWRGILSPDSMKTLRIIGLSRADAKILIVRTLNATHELYRDFMDRGDHYW